MPSITVIDPIEVANRLEQLGWTRDQLLQIVERMVAARNNCTDNDPASARGWMAWKEGTRRTREIGLTMGLKRVDIDGIPWTMDVDRHIKISVANTDDATGNLDLTPQNRNKKGPGTERAVSGNQGVLFEVDQLSKVVPLSRAGPQPGFSVAWFLCVYHEGDEVRAEFSCPIMTKGGFFSDFMERLVLIGLDPHDGIERRSDDESHDDEFNIPVSRK